MLTKEASPEGRERHRQGRCEDRAELQAQCLQGGSRREVMGYGGQRTAVEVRFTGAQTGNLTGWRWGLGAEHNASATSGTEHSCLGIAPTCPICEPMCLGAVCVSCVRVPLLHDMSMCLCDLVCGTCSHAISTWFAFSLPGQSLSLCVSATRVPMLQPLPCTRAQDSPPTCTHLRPQPSSCRHGW